MMPIAPLRRSRRLAAAGRESRGPLRNPVQRVTTPVCLYSCSTLSHTPRTPPPLCWSLRAPASCSLGTRTPCQTPKVGFHLRKSHLTFVQYSLVAIVEFKWWTLDWLLPVCADDGDEEFSDDQLLKLPPVGPPSWDSNVVCIQPTRNHSRPEGHEESEEKQNNNNVSLRSEISVSSDVQYKVKLLSLF